MSCGGSSFLCYSFRRNIRRLAGSDSVCLRMSSAFASSFVFHCIAAHSIFDRNAGLPSELTLVQGWGNGKPLPLLYRCPKQHGWPPYCRLTRPSDCHRHGVSETPPTYEMLRRIPAWVVPRRNGARNPGVSDRAPSNDMQSCARGAADPAPRPSDCGCSRRRARNGVLARRRHAGHLIYAPQVSASSCRCFVGSFRCFFGASLCRCVVMSKHLSFCFADSTVLMCFPLSVDRPNP